MAFMRVPWAYVIQVALVVKNLRANAGDAGHSGLIPGVGDGNSLQYSCLESSMDRGA